MPPKKGGMGNPVKKMKELAQKEALMCPMHRTGHTSFDHRQSEVLKMAYKHEQHGLRPRVPEGGSPDRSPPPAARSPQKPIPAEVSAVLLEGTSRQGLGRSQYLKLQSKNNPKDRYHAPMTSAQVCGWDADTARFQASPHSKKQVLKNTMMRKQGVFNPDLA